MALKLVIDTNIIISALIQENSLLRDLLFSDKLEFYCPEHLVEEIEKHKQTILDKSGLKEKEFYFVLYYLLKRVRIVKEESFAQKLDEAKMMMKEIDIKDADFLALALSIPNEGIFSHDKHFDKTSVKRWEVKDILGWFEKNW